MNTKISRIAVHRRIDSDEAVSCWLIRTFSEAAEKTWPGVTEAKMVPFTTDILAGGKSEKDFPDTLFIGCGKGNLDEHETKRQDQCASTRVAHAMGIRRNPSLKWLLEQTLAEDRAQHGVKQPFAATIKVVSAMWAEDPERLVGWVSPLYDAILEQDQRSLPSRPISLNEAENLFRRRYGAEHFQQWKKPIIDAYAERDKRKEEARRLVKEAVTETLQLPNGDKITMKVVSGTDNDQVNYVSWAEHNVGVLVQQWPEGNVQVYTKQSLGLDLREAAALLRERELEVRGLPPIKSWQQLKSVDTVKEVPQWHLFNTSSVNKPILFNGSSTAQSVEPTALSLDEVCHLVKKGLDLTKVQVSAKTEKVAAR